MQTKLKRKAKKTLAPSLLLMPNTLPPEQAGHRRNIGEFGVTLAPFPTHAGRGGVTRGRGWRTIGPVPAVAEAMPRQQLGGLLFGGSALRQLAHERVVGVQ